MDKLGDIDLFVKVVKNRGLAATAREMKISPASVTVRVNRLEKYYGVRLLNRTTRQVVLTEEGKAFYDRCLRILSEIDEAEELLKTGRDSFSGPLNITAPIDLGRSYIAPLLAEFCEEHPCIIAKLHLSDGVVNLIEENFDIGIRLGVLKDSRMIARKLITNKRVLCASPGYIKKYGAPSTPQELNTHRCMTMVRQGEPLREWHFSYKGKQTAVLINSALSSNDGSQIRQWALDGYGIALKSYLDIYNDLKSNKLVKLLDNYTQDFEFNGIDADSDLSLIYPNRDYLPERVRAFIKVLLKRFSEI